jgi:mannose-6-phosphate isomerase-like protein (cupin superfamily)
MNRNRLFVVSVLVLCALAAVAVGAGGGKAVVIPKADLQWKETGIPKVSVAVVDGDMAKGPSHFYLKYGVGLVTPTHHHTADHYVTVVSGTLTLTANGKEQRLGPGSYFAFTDGAVHSARVDGSEDAVMFVDARAAWDVVPEKQ